MRVAPGRPVVTFVLAVGLGLVHRPARAETTQCTAITSLPTTITASGIYCLTSDFSLSLLDEDPAAITIEANNVVIDLNGHKIGNLSAGIGTYAIGIWAEQRQNITVRNGTVRGFFTGIFLEGNPPYTTSQGHLVEDIRADQNTSVGIEVNGRGCIVRRNQVVATGGTTGFSNAPGRGIHILGPGNRVIDNDVMSVTKTGTGTASGIVFGAATDDGIALENRVTDAERGIEMAVPSVKYRNNLTTSVATPYAGGSDAGNNN